MSILKTMLLIGLAISIYWFEQPQDKRNGELNGILKNRQEEDKKFVKETASVSSQNLKVHSAKKGKVRITSGKKTSIIDLSKDISGCFVLYDGSDPKSPKFDVTKFDLIDWVKKDSSIYLVLLATAGANCNIQGECGATEDSTLVWLKLNTNLKLKDKKAVTIESCRYENIVLETGGIELVNGELKVEYSEDPYIKTSEYKHYTLTYKKAEAEKGFTIVSEKRERPKN